VHVLALVGTALWVAAFAVAVTGIQRGSRERLG
jgi:hypothetical protein